MSIKGLGPGITVMRFDVDTMNQELKRKSLKKSS